MSKPVRNALLRTSPFSSPRERLGGQKRLSDKSLRFALQVIEVAGVESATSAKLVEAFAAVNRSDFIESAFAPRAFQDISLPIGRGQTISKPSTVARMLGALEVKKGDRVLEVGVGCGYVSALLSVLGAEVYGVEKVPSLAQDTRHRLDKLGFSRALIRCGDGAAGLSWRLLMQS